MILIVCVGISTSCHPKEQPLPPALLTPPLGISFSIPSGDVSYFNFSSLEVIHTQPIGAVAIVASEITPSGGQLVIADAEANRISVLDLPGLEVLAESILGGDPSDIAVDGSGNVVYAVTLNGNLWRYTVDDANLDTLEASMTARRVSLRLPDRNEAWVACPRDSTVRLFDLVHFQPADTLRFDRRPTDVKFSLDGLMAYVALSGTPGAILAIDPGTLQVVDSQEFGIGSFDLSVNADDHFVAAADSSTGKLFVWNVIANRMEETLLGGHVMRPKFARHSDTCYVMEMVTSRVFQVAVSDTGLTVATIGTIPTRVRNFTLWEAP
jgi:DNA-binding beta-propeller fold protein YncE